MKTLNSISSLLLLFGLFISSNVTAQLKLKVNGVSSKQGSFMIAVYDSQDDFMKQDAATKRIVYPLKSYENFIEIEGLALNQSYAIAVYHDKNNNGKLDTNIFGIPSEVYGFSNDARGTFGPPSYSEAKVFCSKNKTVVINLR